MCVYDSLGRNYPINFASFSIHESFRNSCWCQQVQYIVWRKFAKAFGYEVPIVQFICQLFIFRVALDLFRHLPEYIRIGKLILRDVIAMPFSSQPPSFQVEGQKQQLPLEHKCKTVIQDADKAEIQITSRIALAFNTNVIYTFVLYLSFRVPNEWRIKNVRPGVNSLSILTVNTQKMSYATDYWTRYIKILHVSLVPI